MDNYFPGRKKIVESNYSYERGKVSLSCTVFARWKDVDSKTAHCGADGSFKVTATVGLTQTDSEKLKSSVGGSIGIEKVASLKSSLESEIGREISWELAATREDTFSFKAPECGRRTETVYQLMRDYDFVYSRQRLFRNPFTWHTSVPEYVQRFHAVTDIEQFDPRCKCPTPEELPLWRTIDVQIGPVTMELGYVEKDGSIDIDFGNRQLRIPHDGSLEFKRTMSTDSLPPIVRFLGEFSAGEMEAVFRPRPIEAASLGMLSVLDDLAISKVEAAHVTQVLAALRGRRTGGFSVPALRRMVDELMQSFSIERREEQADSRSQRSK